MSSTRLPGKTLMDLGGKPVVDHVIARARRAKLADDLFVATTIDPSDDVLAQHLEAAGVSYVRGSLDDVLARYVQAAEASRADTIVRITCDCPLIDPDVIDGNIAAFRTSPEVDYCSNTLRRTYPIGMDNEVFSREALERAHPEAVQPHEREHVTPYLYQHPELFRLRNVEAPEWATWPELRLTVDEAADLDMLGILLAKTPQGATLSEVLATLKANPEIAKRNAAVRHRHVGRPRTW
jgi:spore coat polysaccharide biosynthesis protein SpsF